MACLNLVSDLCGHQTTDTGPAEESTLRTGSKEKPKYDNDGAQHRVWHEDAQEESFMTPCSIGSSSALKSPDGPTKTSYAENHVSISASIADSKVSLFKRLDLTITPNFDQVSRAATALHIRLAVQSPDAVPEKAFLWLYNVIGNTPSQRYGDQDNDLEATDDAGSLPLTFRDEEEGSVRRWYVSRPTVSDVVVAFTATPRMVDRTTPMGPREDLRADTEGLLTAGSTIIPIPVDLEGCDKAVYEHTVRWNLEGAPAGTRTVWTFGEGPEPQRKVGGADILTRTVYAVGPIQSHDRGDQKDTTKDDYFGFYWFGNLPPNLVDLPAINKVLFEKMSVFFKDPPSVGNPYRIFVRKATPAPGFGGSAFHRSYIFEYDSRIAYASDVHIADLLAHEMVHNWPLLNDFPGTTREADEDVGWYSEGIAVYYSALLPYRFGLIPEKEYIALRNNALTAYYTNPLVNLPNSEAKRIAWTTANALTLQYYRGFTYLVQVDSLIRKASGGARSVDDIVLVLLDRKRNGREDYAETDWMELLGQEIGAELAAAVQRDMADGHTIVPVADCLDGFRLVRFDQEPVDFGFDLQSLDPSVWMIQGLKKGSRADLAGVREGDRVTEVSYLALLDWDHLGLFTMKVQRDGVDLRFEWWPRAWEKVESWQWVQREGLRNS
ncbi:hypothetical protein HKX48_006335 [Thoreauomyces humboldtii]|nr:hypothetical protein HKX48_006335 [Thoreauomyces humboldtii]